MRGAENQLSLEAVRHPMQDPSHRLFKRGYTHSSNSNARVPADVLSQAVGTRVRLDARSQPHLSSKKLHRLGEIGNVIETPTFVPLRLSATLVLSCVGRPDAPSANLGRTARCEQGYRTVTCEYEYSYRYGASAQALSHRQHVSARILITVQYGTSNRVRRTCTVYCKS